MEKFFVTFGPAHVHSVNGKTFDTDCVCVIEAEDAAKGREIAFEAFGPVYAFLYPEVDWDDTDAVYFQRGFIDLEDKPAETPEDAILAELKSQVEDKINKLNQELSSLYNFSTNGEVRVLVEAARSRLRECFGEGCEIHSQSVDRRYSDGPHFYAMLYATVHYEAHLEHCDDSSFLTPSSLRTTWGMEGQDLVCVRITSTLPDEVLATLVDLGKLKTVVSPASTYQTISCSL